MLQTFSSTIMGTELRGHVKQYLDSTELHYWLQRNRHSILDQSDDQIPIFLFHFSSETTVLLDRYYQAVSYNDMVLAVQSNGFPFYSDFMQVHTSTADSSSCGDTTVLLDPRDVTRPVLSAVLETAWGISPSYPSESLRLHTQISAVEHDS